MRGILFLIVYCALVNGNCDFLAKDDKDKKLQADMQKWDIFNKTFTESTYRIGICKSPVNQSDTAAIIQQENNNSYVLGQLNSVKLVGGDNWVLLTYENGTSYNDTCNNKTRSASIIFVCDQNKKNIKILQEHSSKDQHCNYMFQFHVQEMCPIVTKEKSTLSGGAIFLIIILCLASAYLIAGFLFMRIKRGARGIDQIPNLEMWRKLGHLSADGCDYCCRCKTGSPRAGYFLDDSGPDVRGDDDILSP